jgi:anaerobic sulfite reductase subunit B
MSYSSKEYKIESIKKYTPDVWLFRVKCSLNPMPGQFIEVSLPGIGECPLASCSCNSEYVDMLVRNVGLVTSQMFKLKAGDGIWIRGNYGRGFPLKKLNKKRIILIAGGTGIAPVTSLIDYYSDRKDIEIYFGFRNEEFILLEDRITKWKSKKRVTICLDKINDSKNKGKFEEGFVHEVLAKNKPNLSNAVGVLCGPEMMMKSVSAELNHLGLDNSEIFWSLERRMECGIGNCGRCMIQDVYVCKDGPVFRYDLIKPKIEAEEASNKIQ